MPSLRTLNIEEDDDDNDEDTLVIEDEGLQG